MHFNPAEKFPNTIGEAFAERFKIRSRSTPNRVAQKSATKRMSKATSSGVNPASSTEEFEQWYAEFGPELLRYCKSRLGESIGEDVFQDVWLKVLNKHHQFAGGNVRAWLYQITRNTIIDWTRKKKPEAASAALLSSISVNSEEEPVVNNDELQRFRDCVSKLTTKQRDLLHLRVTGHSYKQISAALSITVGTVGSNFKRVCDQLRRCVGVIAS